VERLPSDDDILIESDSKYAIGLLTSGKQEKEDTGYLETENSDLVKATVARLRKRQG